ncbi:MAG: hypothetical protein R3A79_19500 [Nannocystaceae bacterium]
MHEDEIDAMIARGRAALLEAFDAHLRESGLTALRPFAVPLFQVHVKKQRFLLQVSCAEALVPEAHGLRRDETTDPPRLLRVDPETGERHVVLSLTPRAYAVFQAHSTFAAPKEVVVDARGDAAALRGALAAGSLAPREAGS